MTEKEFNSCVLEKEIELCIKWLSMQDKLKHPNRRFHSYKVKHIIENYYKEYISESSLIEAVKRVGFPYSLTGRGRSIYLCVSTKTVNKSIKHYLSNPCKCKFNPCHCKHATS